MLETILLILLGAVAIATLAVVVYTIANWPSPEEQKEMGLNLHGQGR